ncbi:hypothetical protein LDENG_00193060 [Lucifuga dentata]|nr:hypothetical protein LDENG_00193060 [Lucifuga dentata]
MYPSEATTRRKEKLDQVTPHQQIPDQIEPHQDFRIWESACFIILSASRQWEEEDLTHNVLPSESPPLGHNSQ